MRLIILWVMALSVSMPALARTVYGKVLSDNDSTAVAGAVCSLQAHGKILESVMTGDDGAFSLQTHLKDALNLEISMTGFNPTSVIVESGGKNIDLGIIYLSEGTMLQEVTVTGSAVSEVKGRTVVFPSMADVKASPTTLGLFQKLPLAGLDANPVNRTLSVDGGSPVILIDGVPSTIDDFNSLQPKDILKIEYSRVTPARYADRGASGMINILLKKRDDGGSVYLWGRSATATAFVDGNFRGSYHQGPSQFNIYYVPSWRNYKKVFDTSDESYVGDDFRVDLRSHDRNPFNYFSNSLRFKYNYRPDDKTLFSATFSAGITTNKSIAYGETEDTYLGDYKFDRNSHGRSVAPSLDLFFRREFNPKNSIEAQVVGTLGHEKYYRDNRYLFTDGSADDYETQVKSRRRSLISEISYIHNFSDATSLSAGVQNTLSHSRNSYLQSDYEPILTENNNYIYARLGQQVGKVYFSIATGAKLFWVKNDLNRRHFIRNLTTVQANWNIDTHWSVQGYFQYFPSIPSLASLTDYPQQTSPYLISNGNPDLKVAENFRYRIAPSFKAGKFTSSLYLTYSRGNNSVINDLIYLGDSKFLTQSVNARKAQSYTASLNLKVSDIHGFGANLNVYFERYEYAGDGWSHDLNSVNGSISLWWNKGPFTVSYWRKLPGKYLYGHVVGKEENGDALSLNYSPDQHWNFGVDWMYMFDTKGTKYPSWSYSSVNPSVKDRYIKNNGNMIVLSVSYSADFGSIFRTGKRSLNNADNSSSIFK